MQRCRCFIIHDQKDSMMACKALVHENTFRIQKVVLKIMKQT